tara:strand:- start:428 stop:892 length:465 start_codon:yes stop_codon:yes gene_type:complete
MPNTPKIETIFGKVTQEEFDKKSKNFDKNKYSMPNIPATAPTPKMSARNAQKPNRKEMTLFGRKPSPRKRSYLDDLQTYDKNMADTSGAGMFVAEPNSESMREHKESLKAANRQVVNQARKDAGRRNTQNKASGGVVKPRGYGMARSGKACKMM